MEVRSPDSRRSSEEDRDGRPCTNRLHRQKNRKCCVSQGPGDSGETRNKKKREEDKEADVGKGGDSILWDTSTQKRPLISW